LPAGGKIPPKLAAHMLYIAVAERTRSVFVTADEELRSLLAGLAWVVGPDER
jgi:hypothetical protein